MSQPACEQCGRNPCNPGYLLCSDCYSIRTRFYDLYGEVEQVLQIQQDFFEPVKLNNNELMTFVQKCPVFETKTECDICTEDQSDVFSLPCCFNRICKGCCDTGTQVSSNCPYCRKNILETFNETKKLLEAE
jgi:hypothetical protein